MFCQICQNFYCTGIFSLLADSPCHHIVTNYNTNQFKTGLKVLLDGDPYSIVQNDFVKPGKGQAFVRTKFKNLNNGKLIEKTFKSGVTVEAADVMCVEAKFLYRDASSWHFMRNDTFEQYQVLASVVGDYSVWMVEGVDYELILHNNAPISIAPPKILEIKVTSSEMAVKGDTAMGGSKEAVLESGAKIRVPLFVNTGDVVKVDPRSGQYLSRSSK